MTDDHLAAADVDEYWAPDAAPDVVERIEAHLFACADCAGRLEAARTVIDGIRDAVRGGRFQAVVTDAVLNCLARDGVRMRAFTVEPGAVVPCAVWTDDQVIVTRMRADFTGVESVNIVMQVGGVEVDRLTDVPVRPGASELIEAFSADQLRGMPETEVRLRVFGAASEALVAEYVLAHGGAFERPSTSG